MVLVKPLTVHWHQDSAPIYSVGFQAERLPPVNRSARFATAGGDNNVRIWRLKNGAEPTDPPQVEYLATLSKHEGAVNAVRFNDDGTILASAGDDGVVCLWVPNPPRSSLNEPSGIVQFGNDFEDQESWRILKKCRTANFGEIYDLAWSPSGRFLAATSMDKVVSIIDTQEGICIASLTDHKHYVQGVAWDPWDQFLATQSSDQTVLIYAIKQSPKQKIEFGVPKVRIDKCEIDEHSLHFHSESFSSFFRRLSFSPDGSSLIVPAGSLKHKDDKSEVKTETEARDVKGATAGENKLPGNMDVDTQPNSTAQSGPDHCLHENMMQVDSEGNKTEGETIKAEEGTVKTQKDTVALKSSDSKNCLFIYSRGDFKKPKAVIPLPKESLAVRFSPIIYNLRGKSPLVNLPYRMVYAVATLNGVFLYDTEQSQPLGMAANLHYSSLTDLAWSPDGRQLLVTSIDGFCSVLRFDKDESGIPSKEKVLPRDKSEQHVTELTTPGSLPEVQTPQINTSFVRKKKKNLPAGASDNSLPAENASKEQINSEETSPTVLCQTPNESKAEKCATTDNS